MLTCAHAKISIKIIVGALQIDAINMFFISAFVEKIFMILFFKLVIYLTIFAVVPIGTKRPCAINFASAALKAKMI
jgi:hypothetical protein